MKLKKIKEEYEKQIFNYSKISNTDKFKENIVEKYVNIFLPRMNIIGYLLQILYLIIILQVFLVILVNLKYYMII